MAKAQGLNNRLKLSDLKKNAEYPMGAQLSDGKCLIHVKLTDFCVKSVESLINSEKVGSCFFLCTHTECTLSSCKLVCAWVH